MEVDATSISVSSQNARAVAGAHVCERYVRVSMCACVVRRALCLQRGGVAGERTHSTLLTCEIEFSGGSRAALASMVFSSQFIGANTCRT